MKYRDYYEVLGIDKTADEKTIRKAYRKLAKQYHPDHNPDDKAAEDKFKEISEAYEVLSDSEKRQKYDQFGHDFDGRGGTDFDPRAYGFEGGSFHSSGGGDYSDFFNMFFGDDLFGRMSGFGSGFGGAGRHMKGQDIEATLGIEIEEGHHGTKKSFRLQGSIDSNITVTIPKGIQNGEKIRLKGKGEPSRNGGQPGDLILKVEMRPGIQMELQGLNVVTNLKLMPWEAWFGCEKTVTTLDGNMSVKVPKGISSGKKIRLKDKGYRNRKGQTGHHYLKVVIDNPKQMTAEMEKHYKALAGR